MVEVVRWRRRVAPGQGRAITELGGVQFRVRDEGGGEQRDGDDAGSGENDGGDVAEVGAGHDGAPAEARDDVPADEEELGKALLDVQSRRVVLEHVKPERCESHALRWASQGGGMWQGCGAAHQNEQHDQQVAMKADRTSTGRF